MTTPTLAPADAAPAVAVLDGISAVLTTAATHGLTLSIAQIDMAGRAVALIARPWPTADQASTLFAALGDPTPTTRPLPDPGAVRFTGHPTALPGVQLSVTALR